MFLHQTLRVALSLCILLSISRPALGTNPYTAYAVDFPDPSRIASGNLPSNLAGAEDTIIAWADEMASYGPWSALSDFCHIPELNNDS